MKRVVISGPARRDLRRLTPRIAERVAQALSRFAQTGQGDVSRLQGSVGEFRLRVGDWRVRFTLTDDAQTIEVSRILPRGRAYRD